VANSGPPRRPSPAQPLVPPYYATTTTTILPSSIPSLCSFFPSHFWPCICGQDCLKGGMVHLWLWHTLPNQMLLNMVIHSTHMLVQATNEQFLPAGGTFRAILASESHWLQRVLVLSVHWWPAPASVGSV
jgi:hypothetical protein